MRKTVFLGIMTLLGGIFTTAYLIVHGNKDEIYTDVLLENTSAYNGNKSSEMNLIYILIVLGVLLYVLFYFWNAKSNSSKDTGNNALCNSETVNSFEPVLLCFLVTTAGTLYFIYQNQNPIVLCALLLLALIYYIDRTIVAEVICFFFLTTYAVQGLYCLFVALGEEFSINYTIALSIAAAFTGVFLLSKDRKAKFCRALLIVQFFVPFLWLALVQSKYLYQGDTVIVPVPNAVKIFVYVMVVCSLVELLVKRREPAATLIGANNIISLGSCIAIAVYNNFSKVGAVLPTDMHHPFENIIGFSQVFELGQELFTEYIPVSGMYSLLHGAIFKWFGNGLASNYYIATNIFYALFIIAIAVMLSLHIKRPHVLLICLMLPITEYDRVVLILPIMLLLSLPALIKRKNLWLAAWFLTSFIHGLYYPLLGAAVCIAFMPLGIWQIYTFIKLGELKKSVHKISFWIGWGICFFPVLFSIPILWGTAQHILAMSEQSIHSDGMARFGQVVAGGFFVYLKEYEFLRIALYYIVSFLVPALFIWVAVALTLEASEISIKRRQIKNLQAFGIGLSISIMLVIAYSYTMVRLDIGNIYSRSLGPLIAGAVMLFVYNYTYVPKCSAKWKAYCFVFFIPALVCAAGFTGNDSKMLYYYTVSDEYQYIQNETDQKLGTGFIEPSQYKTIQQYYAAFQKQCDLMSGTGKEMLSLGTLPSYGFYYLFDVPVASMGEILSIRGYDAAQETVDLLKTKDAIVGPVMRTWQNYYIYHYLVTSGDYWWDEDTRCFLPSEEPMNSAAIKAANKNVAIVSSTLELGKHPSSLGKSMESLSGIFTVPELEEPVLDYLEDKVAINFSTPFDGDDADWLYIEFDVDQDYQYTLYSLGSGEVKQEPTSLSKYLMKKDYNPDDYVCITWFDDNGDSHGIRCRIEKGKLLVPLGCGVKYLLNEHDQLVITADHNGERVGVPSIKQIQLLKLQEVT